MDLFVQKKQRENMRDELRKMISETLGPSAWQELIRMENEIRQKQKDAMYRRIERKETIIAWAAGLFLFLICVGALFGFVWIAVKPLMADGISGIGSAPFNVGSDIHQQTQTRERIETHLAEQMVAKQHRANHAHLGRAQGAEVGSGQGL